MKVTQTWKRNTPSTIVGESLTITITYSSFYKDEIDRLERVMPRGVVVGYVSETDKRLIDDHLRLGL